MTYFKLPALLVLCISFVGMSLSFSAHSQGLGDVKQLCDNATAANKAMAKQAGYDLDTLCAEVASVGQAKTVVPEQPKVARQTVATETDQQDVEQIATAVAPVAVAGVGEIKPAADLKPFGLTCLPTRPRPSLPLRVFLCRQTTCWDLAIRWISFFMVSPIVSSP